MDEFPYEDNRWKLEWTPAEFAVFETSGSPTHLSEFITYPGSALHVTNKKTGEQTELFTDSIWNAAIIGDIVSGKLVGLYLVVTVFPAHSLFREQFYEEDPETGSNVLVSEREYDRDLSSVHIFDFATMQEIFSLSGGAFWSEWTRNNGFKIIYDADSQPRIHDAAGNVTDHYAPVTVNFDPRFFKLSIDDALPVTEGAAAEFTVHLDRAWMGSAPLLLEITPNPTSADLKFKNSQYKTDWQLNAVGNDKITVQIAPGESEATFSVLTVGDNFIEADEEKFSIQVKTKNSKVKIIDDVAVGIIEDDEPPQPGAFFSAVPPSISPEIWDYLHSDLRAAVEKIGALLPDLPSLDISVTLQGLKLNEFASGGPVLFDVGLGGQIKSLPSALIKYQYGLDISSELPDINLALNQIWLAKFYGGSKDRSVGGQSVDMPSILAHEILHGFGIGIKANAPTPWQDGIMGVGNGFRFEGTHSGEVLLASGVNGSPASHLASIYLDLMGAVYQGKPTDVSQLDLNILKDLGYAPSEKVASDHSGNDIYAYSGGPAISEAIGAGDDTVFSSVDYALPDNFETLVLMGGAVSGTGNAAANGVIGNNLNNILSGDEANDLLSGGIGKDTMSGGADADWFSYDFKSESVKGANRDVILDFSGVNGGELDQIDLFDIDAKKGAGNQAFKFIGAQKFHHKAGELQVKYNAATDIAIVSGDIDGNGKADFQIEVHSIAALAKADFIL